LHAGIHVVDHETYVAPCQHPDAERLAHRLELQQELLLDPAWILLVVDGIAGLAVPLLHFFSVTNPVN
jgi:hypothetical protein